MSRVRMQFNARGFICTASSHPHRGWVGQVHKAQPPTSTSGYSSYVQPTRCAHAGNGVCKTAKGRRESQRLALRAGDYAQLLP